MSESHASSGASFFLAFVIPPAAIDSPDRVETNKIRTSCQMEEGIVDQRLIESSMIIMDDLEFLSVKNRYFWQSDDEQLNHVANVRYAHDNELSDLPGVVGIGIGKDHIILYVSDESVEAPKQVEDVTIVKICRK